MGCFGAEKCTDNLKQRVEVGRCDEMTSVLAWFFFVVCLFVCSLSLLLSSLMTFISVFSKLAEFSDLHLLTFFPYMDNSHPFHLLVCTVLVVSSCPSPKPSIPKILLFVHIISY